MYNHSFHFFFLITLVVNILEMKCFKANCQRLSIIPQVVTKQISTSTKYSKVVHEH